MAVTSPAAAWLPSDGPEGLRLHAWLLESLTESPAPNPGLAGEVAVRGEGDWTGLVALAARHGIAPLLYARLSQAEGWSRVPEAARSTLRDSFLASGVRNALHFRELGIVLRALAAAGIPCLVLKGSHLAALVYEHPAHRSMVDIDLLVQSDDVARAAAELRGLGYVGGATTPGEAGERAETLMHWPRMSKPPGPGIELHWRITRPSLPFQVDIDGLWARSRPADLGGVAARVLSPEDALLYVCVHTASHARESQGLDLAPFLLGLKPICDLAAIVRRHRDDLDWAQVRSRAGEWRAGKCVYLSLWLTRELLRLELPKSVLEAFRPGDFDARWGKLACDQVLRAGTDPAEAEVLRSTFGPYMEWDRRIHSEARPGISGMLGVLMKAVFFPRRLPSGRGAGSVVRPASRIQAYGLNLRRLAHWLVRSGRMAWYSVTRRGQTARYARHIRNQSSLWNWLSETQAENSLRAREGKAGGRIKG